MKITANLIVFLCLSLEFSTAARTKKASSAALLRIKELINLKAEREVAQSDAVANDDANIILRDPDAKPHHDELSVNDPEQYFQGDVELSEKQAEGLQEELLEQTEDETKTRRKRKVGKEPLYKRWPRGRPISYDFAENIPELTKLKIRNALQIWEEHTCIRFKENGQDVDRLEFFDGGGCSSFVGRAGGTQGISISTPGCDIVGIITHEVGHALGLFHEQARPDQQDHIAIHYGNIPIGRWNNFHPVTESQADTYLLPYDAGSVMHYGPYGFASDPYRPTISTLDRSLQNTIGQRAGPSFLDFEAINIAYNCLDKCPQLPCKHGGYTNPNDCTRCECPSGFSGKFCQEVQFSNCGARIMASTDPIIITSPNYPEYFAQNSHCVWLIEAPPGGYVFLEFLDVFHYQCEDTCDKSYVEVHAGADFRSTGYRYCCSTIPKQKFASITNEMLVFHNGFGDQGRGFKAKVWSDKSAVTTPLPLPVIITSKAVTTTHESSTTSKPVKMTEGMTTTEPPELFIITTAKKFWKPKSTTPAPTTTTIASTTTTSTELPVLTPIQPVVPVAPIVPITGDECACGPWSVWQDACTQQCGGCGKRTRRRQCSSTENCRTEDKRPCNFDACPVGTNFLFNNGEFHILWKGCCVGLFRSQTGQCTALEDGDNPFLKIISSLLTPQDLKKNSSLTTIDSKFGEHFSKKRS
uniref:Zinc metalloproteinase n=2 Tax=Panagrolaimus sp. JU765 TaxID=591449 RepID=A0AC34RIY0_9BILA